MRKVGWELLVVLAIFPLGSAMAALTDPIQRIESHQPVVSHAIPPIGNTGLLVALGVLLRLIQLSPVLLVGYLLSRSEEGLSAIHLDTRRIRSDLALVLPVVVPWLPQGCISSDGPT